MRIDVYAQVTQLYNSSTSKVKSTAKTARTRFADAVEISGTGKDYQIAKNAAFAAEDIRKDVVDPIKTQVQSGTYSVSDSDFADKLLSQYSAQLM
jgi:negative regulator of flagellin synthesis FlgM